MNKIVFAFILFLQSTIYLVAQDSTFYDANWHIVDKSNAQYFYISIPFKLETNLNDIKNSKEDLACELNSKKILKIEFSHSHFPDSIYIGEKVKIYDNNLYESLNQCKNYSEIDWPSEEIRIQSGSNYRKWKYPSSGDTGRIIWVFKKFFSISDSSRVFIVKIKKSYIIMCGKGLTMPEKQSYTELYKKHDTIPASKTPTTIVFSTGLIYQKGLIGEFNLMFAKNEEDVGSGGGLYGPKIGVEYDFNRIFAPKIGYDIDMFPISLRLNSLAYLQKGNLDYRILPEIGINMIIVSITYGYNIHIAGDKFSNINNHRISLNLYLPLDKYFY